MTYRTYLSQTLLATMLIVWSLLFTLMALDNDHGSISQTLLQQHFVPLWVSSLVCFGVAALFAWSGLSTLLSKTWHEERFYTLAISLATAMGVSLGFAGLTPRSEIWQFMAQVGVVCSLSLTAIAAGLLLAVSAVTLPQPKTLKVSNDNYRRRTRRTAATAAEISIFHELKDRWQ